MNFYDLFTDSLYLYLSDFRNRLEISVPTIAGSYSIITGFAMDFGVITLLLGFGAGILGVIEKGIKIRREYLALKADNAKAEQLLKDSDNNKTNDKNNSKDNGLNI